MPKDVKSTTDILAVLKTSGEEIEFHKLGLGRLVGDEIIGLSGKPEQVEFKKKSKYHKFYYTLGKVFITEDNREMAIVRRIKEDETKIVYERIPQIHIPLAEIKQIHLKKTDGAMSFVATIGVIGGIILGGLILIAALKESCPFIYSYDGTGYLFDAEPYGGATCPGLQRTEWVKLEHLKEVKGLYRIRLTNEVEETQYTDELKLVVVDHDPKVRIAPDENGVMHTFAQPQPPIRAVDGRGRDILSYVAETDWIFWETNNDDLAVSAESSTKGELIFEFARPAGAAKVKILFNGCNTLWGSQMVKRYLELHGNNIKAYYAALNSRGLAYELLKNWNSYEELYQLQIQVEIKNGWETRGAFVGGGPFISEDKAYVIDLAGVAGNVLRVRLTPPAVFWAINSIAVDYSLDQPVEVRNLEAAEATDDSGKDIRPALDKTDQDYFAMPKTGDWAELAFKVPPQRPRSERTVMAKVSGYYDIHLDATGDAQTEILSRLQSEPGFGGRYGLEEYLKWKKELEKKKLNK